MYSIQPYQDHHKSIWDNMIANSKNATFLFHRDFMEYHQDRFEDASMLIFKGKELIALFPANKVDKTIYSHQGLTYGGLILNKKIKFKDVLNGFGALIEYYNLQGFNSLKLKMLPNIYHNIPSEELSYLMFVLNATLERVDTLSVVDLTSKLTFSKDRIQGVKRAKKYNLIVREEDVFDDFWNLILIPNLSRKHNAKPVHTLEEITCLKRRFPRNIRQFNVYKDDEIIAGTTIFVSDQVAHSQYISANENKNVYGSLDVLHSYLISKVFNDKKYFDFGISNENNGRNINKGLQYWKEGFGARTITQSFYEIETKNYKLLDQVFI